MRNGLDLLDREATRLLLVLDKGMKEPIRHTKKYATRLPQACIRNKYALWHMTLRVQAQVYIAKDQERPACMQIRQTPLIKWT